VVVQVLITQRQPVDALREHLRQLMLNQQRHAPVDKAACQPAQQVDLAVHLAQQESPAIAGNLAGRKLRLHATRKMSCK